MKGVLERAERLYDLRQTEEAIDRMAAVIRADLGDSDPIVLVVMNGGLIPAGHLLTRLDFPLRLDYIHATRYRERTEGGAMHWLKRPQQRLRGETVLIVDDILDEGVTLAEIVADCRREQPARLLTAVLCRKRHERHNGFVADYVGLDVADRYVFGYGMDYKGYWRNAPGIFAIAED
jgi:hypoxanthine phosphoribosyltransferase